MDTPPLRVVSKTSNSSTRHTLTPCRRVGLGRPSSGSLNKLKQSRTTPGTPDVSPVCQNSSSAVTINNVAVSNIAPILDSTPVSVTRKQVAENKVRKVRKCLTEDITKKFKSADHDREINEPCTHNQTKLKLSSSKKDFISKEKRLKSLVKEPAVENSDNQNILVNQSHKTDVFCMPGRNVEVTDQILIQLMKSILDKKNKLELLKVQETYSRKHNLDDLRAQTSKWRIAGQEALRHCVLLARQAGCPVSMAQLMVQHSFPQDLMGYNADDDEFD